MRLDGTSGKTTMDSDPITLLPCGQHHGFKGWAVRMRGKSHMAWVWSPAPPTGVKCRDLVPSLWCAPTHRAPRGVFSSDHGILSLPASGRQENEGNYHFLMPSLDQHITFHLCRNSGKEFCLLFFFLMWTIFTVFIEFLTILLLFYVLVFWPQGMWNLNSPTRDQTRAPCVGR